MVSTGIFLDYVLLRGTPVNKISKVIHVSAFANLLWVMTIILGMVTNLILAKTTDISAYIIAGMFMAIGLRYGIFVSVFGAGILSIDRCGGIHSLNLFNSFFTIFCI